MKRKDYRNILILVILGVLIILGVFLSGNIFGANMDWINQHTVIPDYFRNYFYETKKLIPDIIYTLGSGENAFNFSYYGLLNPIILISYFMPFVSMTMYVMLTSIILYLLSIYLFYRFLRLKFDIKLTTLLTTIFMCASPILFQFHRQIMFVDYLPFLIMALINIDNYDKKNSNIFLILNILSMILTSYYFSVGGILVILIYYIYLNFEKSIKEKLRIFIPITISILMSAVLLIPSLLAILNSREVVTETINIWGLFLPSFNYSNVLYGSYALGLFSISIISIAYFILRKDKASKFLGIILLILISFPIFRYLLNGGLYIRSKILIPFIPLIILILGYFLYDLFTKKVEFKRIFVVIIILAILGLFDFNLVYYLDLLGTTLFLYLYYKFKKEYIITIPIIILSLLTLIISNLDEEYITNSEYKTLNQNQNIINKIIDIDNKFYRISELDNTLYNVNRNFGDKHYKTSGYSSTVNTYYKNFYYDTLKLNNNNYNKLMLRDTSHILFNRLMGVKYVLSNEDLGYGYSKINDNIYKNNYALSLGYASSNIYSLDKFNELGYPYNLKYLLNGIVVDDSGNNDTIDIIEPYNLDLINKIGEYVSLENKNNSYYFTIDKEKQFKIKLNEFLENKLLFITINGLESNSCDNKDISIAINNVENILSCSTWLYHNQNYVFNYLINEKSLSELNIIIKEGAYKIDSIDVYTMDISYLNSNFDEMTDIEVIDNVITGKINITEDSYMTLSLPYDDSFKVYVDDKEVKIEKVNTAFIGFKITKGSHNIKIVYDSYGLSLGKVVSSIGLLLFVIYSLKRKNNFVKMR